MILNGQLKLKDLSNYTNSRPLQLADSVIQSVNHNRAYLDAKIASGQIYYGINTGFGSLCDVKIESNQLADLQHNLVRSHACGLGDLVPYEVAKMILLLKINGLSQGYSGIRSVVLTQLLELYNKDIIPVIYQQGSLGASGDLAPLAHLSMPLFGEGEVYYKGERVPAMQALAAENIQPIALDAKEGLALLNGTQFMSGYGTYCALWLHRLTDWADAIAAMSLDAFNGKLEPFLPFIHHARPHPGQILTAQSIQKWLEGSGIQKEEKIQVQDPYSFRCVPQVHGASKDALDTVMGVLEREINSVTDNPIVFHDEDVIVSGGNFHGQTLALHLDFLALAAAELANISERRIYKLISGQRGLPPFLAPNPGVNSGFMIAQYTAASIVSQNKQLCTPSSVDSIESSNGQEDHVSMGANSATKLYRVCENLQKVLGIEYLMAAQAIDLKRPLQTSPALEQLIANLRLHVSPMLEDRYLHADMVKSIALLNEPCQ